MNQIAFVLLERPVSWAEAAVGFAGLTLLLLALALLSAWRGGLAQCLVGARSERLYDTPPLERLPSLSDAARAAITPALTAMRTAARDMGKALQARDVEAAVPFYVAADGHISHIIAQLTGRPAPS